jgi:hypothetical protein
VLPNHFDLRTCGDVAETLAGLTGTVTLQADGVQLMTSPALQLLVSAVKDGARELAFQAPSKAFLECLELLGCKPEDFALSAEAPE